MGVPLPSAVLSLAPPADAQWFLWAGAQLWCSGTGDGEGLVEHHGLPPAEGAEVSRDAMNGKSLGKDLVAGEKAEEQCRRAQARRFWGICVPDLSKIQLRYWCYCIGAVAALISPSSRKGFQHLKKPVLSILGKVCVCECMLAFGVYPRHKEVWNQKYDLGWELAGTRGSGVQLCIVLTSFFLCF